MMSLDKSIVENAALEGFGKLGYLKAVAKESQAQENLCSWCGRILARLHPRGKPSEQAVKCLRPPTDSDADLALNCLKTVLVEFGWAR